MKNEFKYINTNLENTYSIHYACESLNDSNDNITPRITSITLFHFQTKSVHSFAIHLEAEVIGIISSDIPNNYDKLEKNLLTNFFDFLRQNSSAFYMHWNMRNIVYGFQALEHRYRVLVQKEPFIIPDNNRFNLNDMLKRKYCDDYASHPRLPKLMDLNGGKPRNYLTGKEEVEAFKKQEYIRLYKSNHDKTNWIYHLFRLAVKNELKVEKSGISQKVMDLSESTFFKILGLAGILISIIQFIISLIKSG